LATPSRDAPRDLASLVDGDSRADTDRLIGPDEPWLTTEGFLDALDAELRRRMEAPVPA